ncbi:MAG: HupE/UreJ family protein [Flavobacteriales bacterium]|nr:MAG: HupE/UreJ family protein [Flavobacteriales bacterium]
MQDFWFYIQMGLHHVLDFNAYDHILFLAALAAPFSFEHWKPVLLLATVFTFAHCLSLTLSVFGLLVVDVDLIEFLIPVTIFLTAVFNLIYQYAEKKHKNLGLHLIATAFFGLIHGFGFSNYFKMLMAEEEEKFTPLLGFATGIELSQLVIVLCVLFISYLLHFLFKVKQTSFVLIASILILLVTIPMLVQTFPYK